MNIVIIVHGFPPAVLAGTEIATYNLAKYLSKRGHEIHVITSGAQDLLQEEFIDGFWVHRVYKFNANNSRYISAFSFWYNIFLRIKKINPDIIHIQSIGMALPGILSKLIFQKKYVVWGQGSDVYLPDTFLKLTSKLSLKNASSVIALTEHMKVEMSKIYDGNIIVIPNGIVLEQFAYEINNKSDELRIIIFIGRLHPVKGIEYLIESISIVAQTCSNIRLLIVGEGSDKERLEKIVCDLDIKEYIDFVGKVPNEKIPMYLSSSDVFVLSSLSEGFPLVIPEAMASGLPIIATNVGGLQSIISDGKNGFLVEPKNPMQIAEKLLLLLQNPSLCEKISNNNRRDVKKYTWECIATKLESVYWDII